MKSLIEILYKLHKPASVVEREKEIIRKGDVVRAAEGRAFFSLLSEEIADLHRIYLIKAETNPSCAMGAHALLELTARLRRTKEQRDALVAEDMRKRRDAEQREVEPEPLYVNSGEASPHTI